MTRIKSVFSGRNLLTFAGAGFVPAGMVLILLSWRATPGPYLVGERYPYGGYLESWQVATGFAFVAFGVLFVAGVQALARHGGRGLWWALLASYLAMWFPHAFMGVAFVAYDPTLATLRSWVVALPFIFVWMAAVVAGFALIWRGAAHVQTSPPAA